jgi:hypothetical protein
MGPVATEPFLLDAELMIVLVGEEHHQDVLLPYAPRDGVAPRLRIVELAFAPIEHDREHAGERGIEARLGGERVGELTHRMVRRFEPLVEEVLRRGARPECRARIIVGRRGPIEVELGLPADAGRLAGIPSIGADGPVPWPPPRRPVPRTPVWIIAGGIAGLLLLIGALTGLSGAISGPPTPTSAPARDAAVVVSPSSAAPPGPADPTGS